ncbi:MAG: dihydrodipicolinate synthase family protein [Pirellulales bacterium]
MSKFRGIYPPIITPFDADGNINEQAFRRLVDWYVRAGCHGLWVCGGTGEGVSLSSDERLRMAELSVDVADGRLPIVFHVGAPTTADAVKAARHCHDVGVDAICSVPPYFYGKSDDEIVAYYRALGDATDLPQFLYNLPMAAGVDIGLVQLEKVVDAVPTVIGIKESAGVLDQAAAVKRRWPHLTVFVGRGEMTLSALVADLDGSICASLSMAPRRFVEVYDAFEGGDLASAMEAQRRGADCKRVYERFPVVGSTKYINELQMGVPCGQGVHRLPRSPARSPVH